MLLASLLAGAGACAAPEEKPIDDVALAAEVEDRGSSVETVRAALDLIPVTRLPIPRPTTGDDPALVLRAAAFAWNGDLRAARRSLAASRALARSAGAPGPVMVEAMNMNLDDTPSESDFGLTFDLLGLLGLGRSAAAEALARAEVRRDVATLEQTVWRVLHDAERARLRLAGARARQEALEDLGTAARRQSKRIAILHDRGWLSESEFRAARGSEAMLDEELGRARIETAEAREGLATLAGLPPAAPLLDAAAASALEAAALPGGGPADPTPADLLRNHPDLRMERVAYAVAEAEVRAAAAESWPALRVGPRGRLMPDTFLPGGLISIELPVPSSWTGRLAAALERREDRRERLEDALARTLAAVARARVAAIETRDRIAAAAALADDAAAAAWQAAAARFDVDTAALEARSMALERRIRPLLDAFRAREDAAVAAVELSFARGPRAPDDAPGGAPAPETAP